MEQLIQYLQLPKRVAWPLVFVCALLLWGPESFNKGLGLDLFINEYRIWVGVTFLFFLATGLTPLFPWLYQHITHEIQKRKIIKQAKDKLSALTTEEKIVFNGFINNKTKARDLNIQDGVVSRLLNEGLIKLAYNVSYGGRRGSHTFPINITDFAWDYLHKHPELLEIDND